MLKKEARLVNPSILNGKKILAGDDEKDVLAALEEEILEAAPNLFLKRP
ncbi:MAG: hypothetical protein ACUVTN_02295 [Thermodesulfobacteriota bacterium]